MTSNDYDVFDVARVFRTVIVEKSDAINDPEWLATPANRDIALTLHDRQIDLDQLLAIELDEFANRFAIDRAEAMAIVFRDWSCQPAAPGPV